jgi:hypothetical protein
LAAHQAALARRLALPGVSAVLKDKFLDNCQKTEYFVLCFAHRQPFSVSSDPAAAFIVEEISKQLRAEIDALQEYIARMEDRFLATTWTGNLLAPLKRLEQRLAPADLQDILLLLQRVRDQFSVNGTLAPQIRDLLGRYPQYLTVSPAAAGLTPETALDPAPAESPAPAAAPARIPKAKPPAKAPAPLGEDEESEDLSGLSLDIFTNRARASAPASPPSPREETPHQNTPSPSTLNRFPLGKKKRESSAGEKIEISPRQDLFIAHKIRPADLKSRLQLSLPSQDQVQLDFKLQKMMSGRLVDALREHAEEHSLLLIPRVTQFTYQGTLYPCTAKVLTTLFRPLLGNLQDWASYKNAGFMDETPEAGWAFVPPEALPQTLGHNYFSQQQLLRQRADELGVIPRLVRRRTLVEALYDLITAQLVLGLKINQQTLDATASGPTASDFVCIYSSAEGIRVKNLPRTTVHPSLGVCPSI